MNKALVAAAVAALGLGTACQQDGSWPESVDESENVGTTTEAAELTTVKSPSTTTTIGTTVLASSLRNSCIKGYNPLDHHLAAIGTLVLKCKGSIGPDDFVIREVDKKLMLQPNFSCGDQRADEELKNLLGLQFVEYARALPYFTDQWTKFLERYKRAGAPECPAWKHVRAENAPSPELIKQYLDQPVEVKTHNYWEIQPTNDCREGDCLIRNARLCTSWLGVRFWESGDPQTRIAKTDPSLWKDNTNYGNPDFFDTLGWTHRMATDTGWPPGDLYGAPARWGEICTFYASDLITVATGLLYPIECAPGWFCATQCKMMPYMPTPPPGY